MKVSKDEFAPRVPVWQINVDVDRFVEEHDGWSLFVLKQDFMTRSSIFASSRVDQLPQALDWLGSRNVNHFNTVARFTLDHISAMSDVDLSHVVHVGFHGTRIESWLALSQVFAAPYGDSDTMSQRIFSADLTIPGLPNSVVKTRLDAWDERFERVAANAVLRKDVNPSSDTSYEHSWLHAACSTLHAPSERDRFDAYCTAVSPRQAARFTQWRPSSKDLVKIKQRLVTPSFDVSKVENDRRLVGSSLFTKFNEQEIDDAINAVLA